MQHANKDSLYRDMNTWILTGKEEGAICVEYYTTSIISVEIWRSDDWDKDWRREMEENESSVVGVNADKGEGWVGRGKDDNGDILFNWLRRRK